LHILPQRIDEGKMKIGDLVRWSDINALWHVRHRIHLHNEERDLCEVRQRGIVLDENPKFFFVLWENGELNANMDSDLEVVSESR